MNQWHGKCALVTGASSGLGRTLARELYERGARLALVARGEQQLITAAESLGSDVLTCAADVTDDRDVARVAEIVRGEFGGLDFLCHAAGLSMRGDVLRTPPEQFQELWEVNFLAAVRLAQTFANDLAATRGHLVLIGSLASKVAPRFMGAYPASKFPLVALAQQLRLEWSNAGPHVLLVCPGPIANAAAAGRYEEQSSGLPAEAARAGGGARLPGIDPRRLARQILSACERRQAEVVIPARAKLLFTLSQLAPTWGDWLLRKTTAS